MDEICGGNSTKVSGKLEEVALELRKRVPPLSVFPSEKFVVPQTGDVCIFIYHLACIYSINYLYYKLTEQ